MMEFLFLKKKNQIELCSKNKMWAIKLKSNILNHISESQGQESVSYSKTISVI